MTVGLRAAPIVFGVVGDQLSNVPFMMFWSSDVHSEVTLPVILLLIIRFCTHTHFLCGVFPFKFIEVNLELLNFCLKSLDDTITFFQIRYTSSSIVRD